jgi:beta-glucanase (GH16 family)
MDGAGWRVRRLTAVKAVAVLVTGGMLLFGPSAWGSDSGSSTGRPTNTASSVVNKQADAAGEEGLPPLPEGMELVFSDEFNGSRGDPPDPQKWTPKVGPIDSNSELQYYTNNENAALDGEGHLVLTARKVAPLPGTLCRESKDTTRLGECVWTSARLSTKQACPPDEKMTEASGAQKCKVTTGYNFIAGGMVRFQARIKLPEGQGVVPAFWLLGANGEKWPTQGEIDIFEAIGERDKTYAFIKSHDWFPRAADSPDIHSIWDQKKNFTGEFHTFTFDQNPETGVMTWYIDGEKIWEQKRENAPNEKAKAVFSQAWYPVLNIAVGGNWPGDPKPDSTFPKTMTIDWVRVYQKKAQP